MRYKPKNIAPLHIAHGGLPDKMGIEADRGVGVSVKIWRPSEVDDLAREFTDNDTPQERNPETVVKINKAGIATQWPTKS